VNKEVKDNINPYLIQTYYNLTLNTKINDISVPVVIDSKKWGKVRVGFSLAHMHREVAKNILIVLVTGLISVVIGIIVALVLGRFVTGPIEKFVHSMKMVAQGDLNEEVSIDSHDEFGVLAGSFNKMAKSLRKSEDELRNTYQRLMQKEKMAALGRLTASVAHEIKNPLGIINSAAQILADETKDPEDRSKMVATIIDEVNNLDTKIHDLLYYAKPKPASFQKANLNDILEKKIQFCESRKPEERKIIITRRFNRDIPLLFLDEKQIGEMSLNIIINACEAMPNGGELIISTDCGSQGEISKSNKTKGSETPGNLYDQGFIRVEFKDTGIGIRQENLEKIFDPFFTTKERGNGLGLSTVYRIVERHKGKIEVKSKEGEGTKFIILFPVTEME
jgi:signal transduction histidine kinase